MQASFAKKGKGEEGLDFNDERHLTGHTRVEYQCGQTNQHCGIQRVDTSPEYTAKGRRGKASKNV